MSINKTIATMLRETAEKLDAQNNPESQEEKGKKTVNLMAEGTLENGTKIATPADNWAEGVEVFVVPDEGEPFPLEAGSYRLDTGAVITVNEEGLISSIESAENVAAEKDKKKDNDAEKPKLDDQQVKSIVESVVTERKFASEESVGSLNEVLKAQNELITKLSEQVAELKEPVKMRSEKKEKKKVLTPPVKPIAEMNATERAAYLREAYNG